ncbi:MAG: hypothetical protein PHC64_08090 [Candidatus Gastranaerophilales bacterium]|nr:hypothetical protein [Candidatus Gastranaerophilales bacterium]
MMPHKELFIKINIEKSDLAIKAAKDNIELGNLGRVDTNNTIRHTELVSASCK